jgi:PAS domain-containing protein
MIRDCNRAGEALFKYRRRELVWRHVSMLVPQLATSDLMQDGQPNPRLRFLNRIGRRFEAVAHDGERFATDLFLNLLDSTGTGRLSLILHLVEDTTGNEAHSQAVREIARSEECR